MAKKDITTRFVKAMHQVIANQRTAGGKVINVRAFAKSIGESSSNFSKFNGSRRDVTLEMIERICKQYDVSPAWLILGTGKMFVSQKDDFKAMVTMLEQMLKKAKAR